MLWTYRDIKIQREREICIHTHVCWGHHSSGVDWEHHVYMKLCNGCYMLWMYRELERYAFLHMYVEDIIPAEFIENIMSAWRHFTSSICWIHTDIKISKYKKRERYVHTGWRSSIGYLNLQIYFRKRTNIHMAHLRKITNIKIRHLMYFRHPVHLYINTWMKCDI